MADSILMPKEPTNEQIEAVATANGGRLPDAHARAFYLAGVNSAPKLEWSSTLNDGKRASYTDAVKACENLGDGWRLPTVQELLSIVDYSRCNPAIDVERFPGTKSGAYWTCSDAAWDDDPNPASRAAWFVFFHVGNSSGVNRDSYGAFVRAVRSVPAGQ